jgi:hypothetical protein
MVPNFVCAGSSDYDNLVLVENAVLHGMRDRGEICRVKLQIC